MSLMNHKKVQVLNNLKSHKKPSVSEVDNLVLRLVDKFQSYDHVPLFRKLGWYVPEAVINNMVEAATRPGISSPLAYFITSAKKELAKYKT